MASLLTLACGGGGGDSGELEHPTTIDCETAEIPGYTEVSAFDVCTNCHNSALSGTDRNGAPSSLNFDTYEGAAPESQRISAQLSAGMMPPANSGFSISEGQRHDALLWAECGAPP